MSTKKKIITIAGAVGSGKSSTAKRLAELLAYEHFSSGDFFRKIARERGLSIEDLNVAAEGQQDIDHEVDRLLEKMGQEKHHLIIDSRLAYHWIPDSFKVFLALDHDTAAERIYTQMQTEGRVSQTASSVEEVRKNIDMRVESEKKRYANLYSIDIGDTSHFDLVINTKEHTLEEVADEIYTKYLVWKGD